MSRRWQKSALPLCRKRINCKTEIINRHYIGVTQRGNSMAVVRRPNVDELFADKSEIQRLVAEQYADMAIPDDPSATPQQARAMMLALGIRPEDNEFSQGIIQAREE